MALGTIKRGPGWCNYCLIYHISMSCEEYKEMAASKKAKQQPEPIIQTEEKMHVFGNGKSVPPALQNLSVSVAGVGVWITFEALDGKRGTLHVGNLVNSSISPGKVGQAIESWIQDRRKWANVPSD